MGQRKRRERLGEKLRKGVLVGKRVGPYASTPVTLWNVNNDHPSSSSLPSCFVSGSLPVSVRKLGAVIWEFHQYSNNNNNCGYLPFSTMHRSVHNVNNNNNGVNNGGGGGGGEFRLRRLHDRHHKAIDLSHFLPDPSPSSFDQPETAGSLRRDIAASLIQHHRSLERSNRALQPVSPASYGSSMEVAPYNCAVTPTSSVEFRGRIGESSYSLKTSTELLKVLNRIWSLEEQHASNMSLIKALKTELAHSRLRIKELLRDQHSNRHEIDELMKKIAEEKLIRKSKEHDRLHAAVQSLRDELEDERKLRKRSESLHRKLARELSEVKSSLSSALKDMERERKSRKLLEELCDEFAQGIKDYEQEVHVLKQKSDKDWTGRADDHRLILQISESWLDERLQMRLEAAEHGFVDNYSVIDKLGYEIESLLETKQKGKNRSMNESVPKVRRTSMESVPLNEAISAPQNINDEEDSVGSDSDCIELNKPNNGDFNMHGDETVDTHVDETLRSTQTKKKLASREKIGGRNPSNMQVKFEEQMSASRGSLGAGNNTDTVAAAEAKTGEQNPTEMSLSRRSETCDVVEGAQPDLKSEADVLHGQNSNLTMDSLIRSHLSEVGSLHHKNNPGEASCSYPTRRSASPVRQWMSKLTNSEIEVAESSTKQPPGLKENTLKSKLLEARSRGQRSRLKLFKGSS